MEILQQELDANQDLFVLKDPRICRLLPFWLKVLDDFNCQVYGVIIIRHPLEIMASLFKRKPVNLNEIKALRSWLQHLFSAEHDSRHLQRFFLHYNDLLTDWRQVIDRFSQKCPDILPQLTLAQAEQIDQFLDRGLRHQQFSFDDWNPNPSQIPTPLVNQVKFTYNQFLKKIKQDQSQNLI